VSKSAGTGPSSYKKRIYQATVSQSLRNTVLGHNSIKHDCVTGTSFLLRIMAKIYLDFYNCLSVYKLMTLKKNAKLCCNKTMWGMWCGLLLEHSLTWLNIPLTRFRYHQKALTGLLMSNSCHTVTHLCVDNHLKASSLLKPTQSHWAVTQYFIFFLFFPHWMLQWGPHPLMWFLKLFFLAPTKQVYPLF